MTVIDEMKTLDDNPTISLTAESGLSTGSQYHHSSTFRMGRHADCEICLQDDVVSRRHAEIFFEDGCWWIQDLQSANGLYIGGQRIERAPLMGQGRFTIGHSGPEFSFSTNLKPAAPEPVDAARPAAPSGIDTASESPEPTAPDIDHYKQHYFGDSGDQPAGLHTIMVRRAFADVQKKQKRLYSAIIGVVVLLLLVTGAVAWFKHRQVRQQRELATAVFYSLRALELDLIKLRMEFENVRSLEAKIQVDMVKTQKRKLEENYDSFVSSLDIYRKGLDEKERIILRMARRFGECEINMPDGFVKEVKAYIEKWQSSQRLAKVVARARRLGYIPKIVRAMAGQELPAQYIYLAVQESNLNHRAVGPPTRFGIAKGMWQFIPSTGERYGLRIGPLKDEAEVDALDERHDFQKSTQAAARYLRDIYTTDAQASGLLVMASYNWGEHRVVDLLRSLPRNPRERNFWQLITKHRKKIPDETYDYVFSIFAAAVIGENPPLFGFDFDNPLSLTNNPA